MPRFDGTGPSGMGPMTGRGLGPCVMGVGFRRGRGMGGRGFGRGYGYGCPFYQPTQVLTKEEQKGLLEEETKALKEEIEEVEKELKGLKDQK